MSLTNFPPLRLEDAEKFSVSERYKDFVICVYCGGTTDLYWGYVFYKDGERYHFNRMPNSSLKVVYEVDDCLRYCKEVIDTWEMQINQLPLDDDEVLF